MSNAIGITPRDEWLGWQRPVRSSSVAVLAALAGGVGLLSSPNPQAWEWGFLAFVTIVAIGSFVLAEFLPTRQP